MRAVIYREGSITDRKRIKSEEIALKAGVSRSTVSKVINGYGDVGDETRKRVMSVIREYGYAPNLAARILAGKGVETIGLFFLLQRDEGYDLTRDSIVDQMMALVIDAAARLGYLTLTVIIRNIDEEGKQQIRDIFCQGRIDAGIFIGCRDSEPIIDELVERGYLIGQLDYPRPARQEPNRLIVNYDPLSGEKAIDYLVSLGHRDILGVQGDQFWHDGKQKYAGFCRALQRHGIELRPEWDLSSSFYLDSAGDSMRHFLEAGHSLPSAVFCANDHIAWNVLGALKMHGYRVPQDVSVLGVDDAMLSRYMDPPLTTFRVDFAAMLTELTAQVIGALAGLPVEPFYMEFENTLIQRGSCRRL